MWLVCKHTLPGHIQDFIHHYPMSFLAELFSIYWARMSPSLGLPWPCIWLCWRLTRTHLSSLLRYIWLAFFLSGVPQLLSLVWSTGFLSIHSSTVQKRYYWSQYRPQKNTTHHWSPPTDSNSLSVIISSVPYSLDGPPIKPMSLQFRGTSQVQLDDIIHRSPPSLTGMIYSERSHAGWHCLLCFLCTLA